MLGLAHEIWVSGEPAGYATHVTEDPLPGSSPDRADPGQGKRILMTPAWLDKTVPNITTEVAARTLGLTQLEGSIQEEQPEIPDAVGPLKSGLVTYDAGAFNLFDPAEQPHIPPLSNSVADTACDPHGMRFSIPAGIKQMLAFLKPSGRITIFCRDNELCDASQPFEIPGGAAHPCQLP